MYLHTRGAGSTPACRQPAAAAPGARARGLLALQRAAGNRAVADLVAVQRVIIRPAADTNTDRLTTIHDQLETEETVEALKSATKQEVDVYGGSKAVDHDPSENYLICHGFDGQATKWDPDTMAAELAKRGITSGDSVRLIICAAGVDDGAAQGLAEELGKLGVGGVKIHATADFVNWNVNGPVLVTRYPKPDEDQPMKSAEKQWTAAKDEGWKQYVKGLKAAILDARVRVPDARADEVKKAFEVFIAGRADGQLPSLTAHLKNGRYDLIVAEAQSRSTGVQNRDQDHDVWSQELRTLLDTLDSLTDKPSAAHTVTELRVALRQFLGKRWPAYSKGYFDRLRAIAADLQIEGEWRMFTSQVPAPSGPISDGPALTDDQIENLVDEIPWQELSDTQVDNIARLLDETAVRPEDWAMVNGEVNQ